MDPSPPPEPASDVPRPGVVERLRTARHRVRALPGGSVAWRFVVTLVGIAVIVVGIVLLPLPGPGWLIIFTGLGVLASEYAWARHLLHRSRATVRSWTQWSMRQNVWVRFAIGLGGLVVIAGMIFASLNVAQVI